MPMIDLTYPKGSLPKDARADLLDELATKLLAAVVVSAVEGAIVLSRAERSPAPLLDVAAELEDVTAAALP